MTKNGGIIFIVIICVLVLVIGLVRKRMELLINFIVRLVMGITMIYFINSFLDVQNISLSVGMNPATLLTTGSLGIPGVALLYGILFYGTL